VQFQNTFLNYQRQNGTIYPQEASTCENQIVLVTQFQFSISVFTFCLKNETLEVKLNITVGYLHFRRMLAVQPFIE